MKTKVNEIPFVGPKGRKELLDRIEELEKKVIELEQSSSGNRAVSWEFNLIRNEPYTTWESVNMTQEIYDAIVNETIDWMNVKWYFEETVGVQTKEMSYDESTGKIDVRSGFWVGVCNKALVFDVYPDGTVRVEWD